MILYHAISTYQLLEMILYRQKHSEKDESILMITDTLYEKFPNIEKYSIFFRDVWVYNINLAFSKGCSFQTVIDNYFNNFFEAKGILPYNFDEINAACVHYYFGHYLIGNNIPFIFFEDAAGVLSRPDILYHIEVDTRPFKTAKNVERGLYNGRNSMIKKIVCNFSAQEKGFMEALEDGRELLLENFNVMKELLEAEEDIKKVIKAIFLRLERLDIPKQASIILTQHFANLRILKFGEQEEIYQLFFDYFFQGKRIVIKPHPDDVMYYSKINKDILIIKERFPSELLPLVEEGEIDEISTISSTAIKNYYDCKYKIFKLNTDFEKTYHSIHRYYIVLAFIAQLDGYFQTKYCDDVLFDALIQRNRGLSNVFMSEEAKILVIDDYIDLRYGKRKTEYNEEYLGEVQEIINSSQYETIIFLNSLGHYNFYYQDMEIFKYIIPVKLKIERREISWWEYEKQPKNEYQMFYLVTGNEEYVDRIRSLNHMGVHYLENSECCVSVESISNYEKEIYEGKIKALEERLKYYIKLSKEKEKRI